MDKAFDVLERMNGAQFFAIAVVAFFALSWIIPKIDEIKQWFNRLYERKKQKDEILETILANKQEIEHLKDKDTEYYHALKEMENNFTSAISELKEMISSLTNDSEARYIQSLRSEILDFCNACSVRGYKQEAYRHIMDLHREYEIIIKKRGEQNGQMNESWEVMLETYREHIRNGDFIEDNNYEIR